VPSRDLKGPSGSDAAGRDQRRLHAWPEWDKYIRAARGRLEFDPAWTPQPGAGQSPEYREWLQAVELRRLLAEAHRALIELHLPENFLDYWVACFLAPYERDGFAAILDPQPNGNVGPNRLFPPPMALWFDAGIDYSTAPAKLVIEGPAVLASSAILRAAERRALAAKRRDGLTRQHPLLRYRQIGPALEDRAAERARPNPERARAMHLARVWRQNGDKPSFIAHRLGERGYTVSERTVRRWLDEPGGTKTDTPFAQDETPEGRR
jgi:hypothetical protein